MVVSMKADHFDHMLEGLQALNMEDGVKLLKRWYLKAQFMCDVMNNVFRELHFPIQPG